MVRLTREIAYFSLEIGFEKHIPTYSGGLGILAGDTLRAAADTELPVVGVTLLYRGGYFKQRFDDAGQQTEQPDPWDPASVLRKMGPKVVVPVDGRDVTIQAWRLDVHGVSGFVVPVYFLDTDLEENDEAARELTRRLYAGDTDHRIRQEVILGIGGRRMLRAIGHDLGMFHMNEGHASFVCIELISEVLARDFERGEPRSVPHGRDDAPQIGDHAVTEVRSKCAFTTHTPVEAGHDRFDVGRVRAILGDHPIFDRPDLYGEGTTLNTSKLALNLSGYANAVARKHGEVSRQMFPGYPIEAITNGVHAATWTCPEIRSLFDSVCPDWRAINSDLRMAAALSDEQLWTAHQDAKAKLLTMVKDQTGTEMSADVLTVVFSRRMTEYKRPALLLSDVDRLRAIAKSVGPFQVVYAGKSHPKDETGKGIIREIHAKMKELAKDVPVAFLQSYEIETSKILVSGADVWLNNPRPPLEASGTSGMKAALNGVPSLSTMDGWWLEGWVEGLTGWAIGDVGDDTKYHGDNASMDRDHAASLYDKLEKSVLPLYLGDKAGWANIMRNSIALNGSHFTTERMVREYAVRAYGKA